MDAKPKGTEFGESVVSSQTEIETQQANPATWYNATLTSANGKRFLVELSNGTHVLCSNNDVSISPGQHIGCLPAGTPCWVRVAGHQDGVWLASEIVIDGEPPAKTETVTIRHWRETYGNGTRPCGCNLFCVLLKPYSNLNVQAGDTCSVDIIRSNRDGRGYVGFITKILKTPQSGNGESNE